MPGSSVLLAVGCLLGAAVALRWPGLATRLRAARVVGTPLPPGVGPGTALLAQGRRRVGRRRGPARRRERAVLAFVEAVGAEVASGAPTPSAVGRAALGFPDDPVMGAVARSVELGGDPAVAVLEAAAHPGAHELWAVAACLQVSSRSGAGLAEALGPVAGALRDEQDLAREVAGQLAAPRATARLLAALPLVVWLLGAGLGADPTHVLLATPYGWACLLVGGALEVAGLRWVDRMARSVSSG
jgi:tight adherence protein B